MSRIGKKPVSIPKDVNITIDDSNKITVKGSKGTLEYRVPKQINVLQDKDANIISVTPTSNEKKHWAMWGLVRVLLNNMVTGVSNGFSKSLIVDGVGYRAELKGNNLLISAGYSHPIYVMPPENITFKTEPAGNNLVRVIVQGIDKQVVGQIAAEIRGIRPPEPYKGKGIRYENEQIRRKAGKTGTK